MPAAARAATSSSFSIFWALSRGCSPSALAESVQTTLVPASSRSRCCARISENSITSYMPEESEQFTKAKRLPVFCEVRSCFEITVPAILNIRSEAHTSELQSLMRISYDVFCLKNTKNNIHQKQ